MILDFLGILLCLVMVLLKKVQVTFGFIQAMTGTMWVKLEETKDCKVFKEPQVLKVHKVSRNSRTSGIARS